MPKLFNILFICFSLVTALIANANEPDSQELCSVEQQCVEKSTWYIGLAIGAGARSNPLVDGDPMPMVVMPDIAWYGEAAYFDNGELGYQWLNQPEYALETFLVFDTERAFFSFWQPENIFFDVQSIISALPGFDLEQALPEVSINDVASRDWSINGGIRAHWYQGNSEWIVSWQHDVLNVHSGSKFNLGYQHNWRWDKWRLYLGLSAQWKSQKLLDYYYGLSFRDGVPFDFLYQAEAGWQPKVTFGLSYPLSDKWQFLFRASYQRLNSGMHNSPLVEEKSVQSAFIGAAYRF